MSRRIRTGFTLVELLVVITIIGILAGLLFPAIQSMRNSARQTECLNNLTQVVKGTLAYESAKQKFPGYKNKRPGFPNNLPSPYTDNSVYFVGWVPPMLSYLGRADLYNLYTDPTAVSNSIVDANASMDQTKTWPPRTADKEPIRLSVLVCPADVDQAIVPEMQFVPNGGMPDKVANVTSATMPPDFIENGVFFDRTAKTQVSTSLSTVASKDGVNTTIMFSENADADRGASASVILGWHGFASGNNDVAAQTDWETNGYEYLNTILWFNQANASIPLNKEVDPNDPAYASIGKEHYARPLSAHSGGFQVGFCGGNVRFVSDEINYELYKALMSVDGRNARDAFASAPNTGVKGTARTGADPVSEAQLDQ